MILGLIIVVMVISVTILLLERKDLLDRIKDLEAINSEQIAYIISLEYKKYGIDDDDR